MRHYLLVNLVNRVKATKAAMADSVNIYGAKTNLSKLSAASIWELAIKRALGKVDLGPVDC